MGKKLLYAVVLLLGYQCYAQLPNFSLRVASSPQTCLGNGSLSFIPIDTVPGAVMGYEIYLLPNTTTPVATVTASTAQNLVAGNYLVVATQTSGALSNTATANATIADNVVPLTFELHTTNAHCTGHLGSITVEIATGTAVSYEIISGPVTRPLQTSNVFNDIPAGEYHVRAHDNCGEAVVVTVHVIQAPLGFTALTPLSSSLSVVSCDTIRVDQLFTADTGAEIAWPVTFQYTIHPPDGSADQVVTKVVAAGLDTGQNNILTNIPYYYNQTYYYDVAITDACGTTVNINHNVVQAHPIAFAATVNYNGCPPTALVISFNSVVTFPVTVSFLSAPDGFDPTQFNTNHPVFNGDITYSNGSALPLGTYKILATDACGRTYTKVVVVGTNTLIPLVEQLSCGDGTLTLTMPFKHATSVVMTAAPATYTITLPADMAAYTQDNQIYTIENLPLGVYQFEVTDECGNTFTVVSPIVHINDAIFLDNMPECEIGMGSVNLNFFQNQFTSIIITQAPQAFTQALPFDASFNISGSGSFSMNSLPEGNYTYSYTTAACPLPKTATFTVTGYHESPTDVTLTPFCGSFSLHFSHTSNTSVNQLASFWLQKYNEATGQWMHPLTSVLYPEGTAPSTFNSVQVYNNTTNINLAYTGTFRIVKVFSYYNNQTGYTITCVKVIDEFEFDSGPQITNAYSFLCPNGFVDVAIIATGLPPLSYAITSKNGSSFTVNNGTSGYFTALEPAIYNFQVTDVCGNIRNRVYNINELTGIAITATDFCAGQSGTLAVPDFPFLHYDWRKQGSGQILSTSNTYTIPSFNAATNGGVYTVTVTSLNPGSCTNQLLEYTVAPALAPNAGADKSVALCNNMASVNLQDYLDASHDTDGTWTSQSANVTVNGDNLSLTSLQVGTYVFNYTVTHCGISDEAQLTVTVSRAPVAAINPAETEFCEGSTITFSGQAVTGAT